MRLSIAIQAVLITLSFTACEQRTTSISAPTNQEVTPVELPRVRPDPVVSLQNLSDSMDVSKRISDKWYQDTMYDFKADGIDVQATQSLVSPYIGYIYINWFYTTGGIRKLNQRLRLALAWQQEVWIAKSLQFERGGGWADFRSDAGAIEYTKSVFPKINWDFGI